MQYCKYFAKTMRISQTHEGRTHSRHWNGCSICDYPIDETYGTDSKGKFYAPFDCKVVKKYSASTKEIWLESLDKVITPIGEDYVMIFVGHIRPEEYNSIKVGDTFTQGQPIVSEESDSQSTGYHNHVSAGLGKMSGTGWKKNANSIWVPQSTNGMKLATEIFYVDPNFTTVVQTLGLNFQTLPSESKPSENTPSDNENYIKYIIQSGDTLSEIAQKYNVTVEELALINNIEDVNKIYTGDVLLIPNKLVFKTLNDMYLRKTAGTTGYVKVKNVDDSEKSLLTSTNGNEKAIIKKDSIIEASDIIKKDNGSIWVKIKSGYVCYKGVSGTIYLENYVS